MIRRTLHTTLQRSVRSYPVVTLTGPRQSGKTTIARAALPGFTYVSLEDPDRRGFAREDPRGFLDHLEGQVILDEIQRVPDLFSYIQTIVDAEGHEIDVLIDQGTELVPIEIKSGETLAADFVSGLRFWRELAQTPSGPAALVYGGRGSLRRSGVSVYSWAAL